MLHKLHGSPHGNDVEVISPTLLIVEVASVVARRFGEPELAAEINQKLHYLPYQTMIPLSQLLAEETSRLAAGYELRSADAVYGAVAQLYGSVLVTLDATQLERLSAVVTVWRPEEALAQLAAVSST